MSLILMSRAQSQVLIILAVLLLTSTAGEKSPEICKNSFYPKLCRELLRPLSFHSSSYVDYGRFSVKQALKRARRTAAVLDRYLAGAGGSPSGRRSISVGALEDCRLLASVNAEYLEEVQVELGRVDSAGLSRDRVDRVKSLMSAVVTNQQTCYDGLEDSRSFSNFRSSAANETRLFGVSLELVMAALEGRVRPDGSVRLNDKFLSTNKGRQMGNSRSESSPPSGFPVIGMSLSEVHNDVVRSHEWVRVAQDGSGNFTTIGEAIAFAPNNTKFEDGYFGIHISEGTYYENVFIPKNKKNLILIGAGINRTIITAKRNFVDGYTTFNSATLAVHGDRFIAININFENTSGPEKHQAVAVRNSADLTSFYMCSFLGYQDTLYVHSNRQFYRNCDIYGTVDFIFGNAATVIQNCNIYVRKPLEKQVNCITAQGRMIPEQSTGISIQNCTIRPAFDRIHEFGSVRTFLGRPWKQYSRTVFMESFMDEFIEPAGWLEWNGNFALDTLYYGEFQNHGPGSNTSARVQWPGYNKMSKIDALNFTVDNFTSGNMWLASTSIPYSSGLI